MTDIPQDQVEAVARELCKVSDEKWDAADFTETANGCDPEDAREGWRELARAAIRVLTPMIAEQCAEIADAYATAARAYAPESTEATHVSAARSIAFDIRSVKGAVTE